MMAGVMQFAHFSRAFISRLTSLFSTSSVITTINLQILKLLKKNKTKRGIICFLFREFLTDFEKHVLIIQWSRRYILVGLTSSRNPKLFVRKQFKNYFHIEET